MKFFSELHVNHVYSVRSIIISKVCLNIQTYCETKPIERPTQKRDHIWSATMILLPRNHVCFLEQRLFKTNILQEILVLVFIFLAFILFLSAGLTVSSYDRYTNYIHQYTWIIIKKYEKMVKYYLHQKIKVTCVDRLMYFMYWHLFRAYRFPPLPLPPFTVLCKNTPIDFRLQLTLRHWVCHHIGYGPLSQGCVCVLLFLYIKHICFLEYIQTEDTFNHYCNLSNNFYSLSRHNGYYQWLCQI